MTNVTKTITTTTDTASITKGTTATQSSLKLRSRMVASHQIPVSDTDPEIFQQQLESTISKAPALFHQAPVILDLSLLTEKIAPSALEILITACRTLKLIPFALTSSNKERDKSLSDPSDLAWFDHKSGLSKKQPVNEITETNVIKTPVRSGQQIYAQGAHLLIMNQVSAGAEVIADGNIHILGALRGRAIAGAQGNINAEIICQQLDAELVAIAGNYLVQESFPEGSGSARCILREEKLSIDFFATADKPQLKS